MEELGEQIRRITGSAERETLAIPDRIRAEVDDRDRRFCRMCGRHAGDRRALHHVVYGGDAVGMGGRRFHHPENLITVGYLFEHDCHSRIHADKRRWMPLALEVIRHPGVTMLQLDRWSSGSRARRS